MKASGSSTTKALMQAQQVNNAGVYVIGNASSDADYFLNKEATVQEVVSLKVRLPGVDKVYKQEEVLDLQSRLMLLGRDTSEKADDTQFQKEFFIQVKLKQEISLYAA